MGLSPKKLRAARLLAAGMTRNDVAERLNVHVQTLRDWEHKDEDFRLEIEETANRMADQIESALMEGELKAAFVIDEALEARDKEGQIDWSTRVKAALSLLDRQGRRGKAVERIESKSIEYKGDLNELLLAALRDPGMREFIEATVPQELLPSPVPLKKKDIEDGEYEVIEGDPEGDRGSLGDLKERVHRVSGAVQGEPKD